MNEWEWQLLEDKRPAESVWIDGAEVKKGDRVLLRPRKGGDIFDLALSGQPAIVESLEQDYEGKLHLAVVLEGDPGRDLGLLRQPGHRFFFSPEEVEPCPAADGGWSQRVKQPRILVAGIGNIFLGDDGFGVEVVRRLSAKIFSDDVRIRDFGIRGYDLAYALLEEYELAILVDAAPRGGPPGMVSVIEPDLNEAEGAGAPAMLDAHTMNPLNVFQLARTLGPVSTRILLVACEPASLGGEEGYIGLSGPVAAAVDEAVQVIERLIANTVC